MSSHNELVAKAKDITAREMAVYSQRTHHSQIATERARKVMPAGVPSSFQAYDPWPIVVKHAAGARMIDVDDNEYVDYDMGFGALFAGHMNPAVRKAVAAQLDHGTLYVTPCELNADVGELLAERYGLPMWRPTNSGTEATHDAIRLARGVTGREKIVKVEGGYHGHHDEVMVSNKPSLDVAGPADRPNSVPQSLGITKSTLEDVVVIPYNDADALEWALSGNDVACFIVEPVMENIGICLPVDGYLQAVREICDRHGTLLIFDEVKTGITAGYGGATNQLGVQPDLVTLAKSIGGGFPVGAFGGKAEYMDLITQGTVLHLGTYNGNPLVMAAVKATLTEACTARRSTRRSPATPDSSRHVRASSTRRASRPTPSSSAPRVASPGSTGPSGTIATTRPATSNSPSPSGSTASTAASCCRRASTSSGWSR